MRRPGEPNGDGPLDFRGFMVAIEKLEPKPRSLLVLHLAPDTPAVAVEQLVEMLRALRPHFPDQVFAVLAHGQRLEEVPERQWRELAASAPHRFSYRVGRQRRAPFGFYRRHLCTRRYWRSCWLSFRAMLEDVERGFTPRQALQRQNAEHMRRLGELPPAE